uniref:Protein V2 n=2 Tax=Sweet potato leaf curl virus TaxID=100755 RepID=A0A5P8N7J2_9GEMI|nr:AV2 [Sweet potato leaf curl virus]
MGPTRGPHVFSVLFNHLKACLLQTWSPRMELWDPLQNPLPDTLYGFRCMLSVKYLQGILKKYEPGTLGFELCSELIRIFRVRQYDRANSRYAEISSIWGETGKTEAELRDSYRALHWECCPNCCPKLCPGFKRRPDEEKEG